MDFLTWGGWLDHVKYHPKKWLKTQMFETVPSSKSFQPTCDQRPKKMREASPIQKSLCIFASSHLLTHGCWGILTFLGHEARIKWLCVCYLGTPNPLMNQIHHHFQRNSVAIAGAMHQFQTNLFYYPLVIKQHIAIEHGPFVVDLPIKNELC